jgi:lysophospholipase L1-like esterase
MALTLQPADKMVMFGDSISTGSGWWGPYVTQINAAYTRAGTAFVNSTGAVTTGGTVTVSSASAAANYSPTVIGKGVVGNKVSDLQARVAADVIALSPTVVIIECGVNDLILATPTGTLATNAANLLSTIKASLPTVRLAWVGILCYGENYPDTTWGATVNNYNTVLRTAIEDAGGTYIDVRTPQQTYESIYNVPPPGVIQGILCSDTVHPNATGVQLMSDTAWATTTITGAP